MLNPSKFLYIFVVKALYIHVIRLTNKHRSVLAHAQRKKSILCEVTQSQKTSKLSTFCTSKKYKQAFLLKLFLTFHNRTMVHTYTNLKEHNKMENLLIYQKLIEFLGTGLDFYYL